MNIFFFRFCNLFYTDFCKSKYAALKKRLFTDRRKMGEMICKNAIFLDMISESSGMTTILKKAGWCPTGSAPTKKDLSNIIGIILRRSLKRMPSNFYKAILDTGKNDYQFKEILLFA